MKVSVFIGLVLAVALALAMSGCAHGSGVEFGVFGSTLDSDDLGDGHGGGVKLEVNPIDRVSVDARASWLGFDDTDVDMFPLEVAALLNFPLVGERIVPYIGAGVGYYLFDGSGADLDEEVGYYPLAGLEIGLHSISVLAEARWLFLETDVAGAKNELKNLTEADVDGFGVNVGALIRF
jgi:hypothetical protein